MLHGGRIEHFMNLACGILSWLLASTGSVPEGLESNMRLPRGPGINWRAVAGYSGKDLVGTQRTQGMDAEQQLCL